MKSQACRLANANRSFAKFEQKVNEGRTRRDRFEAKLKTLPQDLPYVLEYRFSNEIPDSFR